jgi:two-component system phosphate regulon sensor histidine kinase PhoR
MPKKNTDILEKNIQLFLDTVGDGVFIVDKNGVIIKSNVAACNMLGYVGQKCKIKVEGSDCLELLSPTNEKGEVIDKKNAALYKSLQTGKKVTNAKRQFIKKDGTRIWASITTSPIVKNKKVKGVILVIRDITNEVKQTEYQKDFAHTASHNLRSPLGNVLWGIEYILLEKAGKLTKMQREYLEGAYNSLSNMNKLINDLLNMSRLQNNKIVVDSKKTVIEDVVDTLLKDLCHFEKVCHSNIKYKKTTDKKKKKHTVKADPEHLRYAIQNVLENAIRYSDESSPITLDIKKDKDYTTFICSNTGIGIPEEMQKFIFAKFFRGKNAMAKKSEGTGLGMYVTKELLRLNRAKIWFESKDSKTTFFIKLMNA